MRSRTGNDTQIFVPGTGYSLESFVSCEWSWLLPLLIVEIASLIFLLVVIVMNGRQQLYAWKSSSLPTLCALGPDDRKMLRGLRKPDRMREAAESYRMSFRSDGRDVRISLMT